MTRRIRDILLLVLLGAAVVLPCLGSTRFWDEDEGYFAGTAAEMYSRGEWIVPYFNGTLFGHKPPWMYWMMMVGFKTFGVNEFGARFFSGVFGVGAAVVTYECGRRLFNRRAGLIAAVALITSLMFSVVSRAATPDSYLVFFSTLALYLFAASGLARHRDASPDGKAPAPQPTSLLPQRWSTFAGMYAVMGLGVLVKGPIGVLFPMAVIGMFLLCMTPRRSVAADASPWVRLREACRPFGPANFLRTLWSMRPLTALAVVLFVAGPWYLAVGLRTHGEFLREFFLVHNLQRFSAPMENHSGSLFYYPSSLLIGMFPWSVLSVPTVILSVRMLRKGQHRGPLVFLTCWAGVYVCLLSLAATKLPNYVLPAYPALALLVGVLLDGWTSGRKEVPLGWIRVGCACLAIVGVGVVAGVSLAALWEIHGQTVLDRVNIARSLQHGTLWLGLLGLPAIVGGVLAVALSWRKRAGAAVLALCATAVATMLVLWTYVAPQVDQFQTPQDVAQYVRQQCAGTDLRVARLGIFRPSMVFYCRHRIESCDKIPAAIEFLTSPEPGLLITTDEQLERLQGLVPSDITVLQRKPQFLKHGEILLLGRATAIASKAAASGPR